MTTETCLNVKRWVEVQRRYQHIKRLQDARWAELFAAVAIKACEESAMDCSGYAVAIVSVDELDRLEKRVTHYRVLEHVFGKKEKA